jgi:IPTL-CTERM motif
MRMIGARLATLWLTVVVALSWLPVTDAIAAKSGPSIFSGAVGPTLPIDNGVVGVNRIEVFVAAGGEADDFSLNGGFGLTDMLSSLSHYVDVGADGAAVQLGSTNITQPPTSTGVNQVTSAGNFAGPNGTIDWTAVSTIAAGSNVYVTTLNFSSANPFGTVRIIQLLDADVLNFTLNNLVQLGTFGTPGFTLLTQSVTGPLGLGQLGPVVTSATCVGWAAAPFSDLIDAVEGGGATYAPAGSISNLSPTKDFHFPAAPAWGIADITSAIACDLSPSATTATIVLSLVATQTPKVIPTLSEWGVMVMVALLAGAAVWRLRRRSLRPAI